MKHLGLFEGIGGFSLAAKWMGWETVAWCEIDPFCQSVLKHYYPYADSLSDIKTTDFKSYANRIDILTGGFPCQPYSTAGKRLGKNDDRHLWPQMLRAIREISPRWVVGENVRGLTNWNGGVVFDEVQADLEAEGYEVLPFLLPAAGVGAPHRRDRIWFVAHAKGARMHGEEGNVREANGRQRSGLLSESKQPSSGHGEQGVIANAEIIRMEGSGAAGQQEPGTQTAKGLSGRNYSGTDWTDWPTQPALCSGNDGIPSRLSGITISNHISESLKAYGNAIVPQLALQIFKAIEQYENHSKIIHP